MLNVSTMCPKPPFIKEGHFLRIPVSDNNSDKLLPYFQDAFQFLGKSFEKCEILKNKFIIAFNC